MKLFYLLLACAIAGISATTFAAAANRIKISKQTTLQATILRIVKHFLLCPEFKDKSGASANTDFYPARSNDAFVVIKTVVDNCVPLSGFRKAST